MRDASSVELQGSGKMTNKLQRQSTPAGALADGLQPSHA
jgi:hypothetical protein